MTCAIVQHPVAGSPPDASGSGRRRAQTTIVKRGGDAILASLSDVSAPAEAPAVDVLALQEALGELMTVDPRLFEVVDLNSSSCQHQRSR